MKFLIASLILIVALSLMSCSRTPAPQIETKPAAKSKYVCNNKKCRTEVETPRTHR